MVAPPRLAKQCELDGSRARMPGDGVTSPMLQREHMRESFPPHPLWAALLEDAPELTCLGNSLCSFICALLLLFRRGRFVELGSGAHLTWSLSVLSGKLVLRDPGCRDIILSCSYSIGARCTKFRCFI